MQEMTRDEMLAYLREAARSGRIDSSVYQRVRDYVSDAEPVRTCHNKYRDHNDRSFLCSKCGYEAFTYDDSYCDPDEFRFCPNCGASVTSGGETGND